LIFHHHLPTENVWIRISAGLILGGAMGNGIDRILRNYVVDFVDVGFWPIFNIADLSVVVGVAILAYFLWQEESHPDPIPGMSAWGK
jgi:signal peptidase II